MTSDASKGAAIPSGSDAPEKQEVDLGGAGGIKRQRADHAAQQAQAAEEIKRKGRVRRGADPDGAKQSVRTGAKRSGGARKKNSGLTSARALKAMEKALDAWDMRVQGFSFHEIAQEVGYNSPQAAYAAIRRLREQAVRYVADEMQEVYAERLEKMVAALWAPAMAGDPYTVDALLRVMDKIDKLYGLSMPTRIAPTNPDGTEPANPITWDQIIGLAAVPAQGG